MDGKGENLVDPPQLRTPCQSFTAMNMCISCWDGTIPKPISRNIFVVTMRFSLYGSKQGRRPTVLRVHQNGSFRSQCLALTRHAAC